MQKCGSGNGGESVAASSYVDVMQTYNIELDKKEIAKINKE